MYKNWLIKFISVFILSIIFVGILNIIIDPFNMFRQSGIISKGSTNVRYQKIEYLKENHSKYNSYIFSSSRVGTTRPSTLEKYIEGSKFYNLYLPHSNLQEIRMHLEYMLKNKWEVKNIYIQIDVTNMYKCKYLDNIIHPSVIDEPIHMYKLKRLFNITPIEWYYKLTEQRKGYMPYTEINIDKGYFYYPLRDYLIQKNLQNYIKINTDFNKEYTQLYHFTEKETILFEIKQIKKLVKEYGINAYYFITPHSKYEMDMYYIEDYIGFVNFIVENLDALYVFSGYNNVTTSNEFFYETIHYLPKVSELIAAKIFNDKSIKVPNDFGIFLTKQMLQEFNTTERGKIIDYRYNLKGENKNEK